MLRGLFNLGSSGAGETYTEVINFSALPDVLSNAGKIYLVNKKTSGILFIRWC